MKYYYRLVFMTLILAAPCMVYGQAASLPCQLQWGEAIQGGQVMANDAYIIDKFDAALASLSFTVCPDWTAATTSHLIDFSTTPQWLQSWCNQGDVGSLATYVQGPLATSTDNAFYGGVLMPNGKVCLVPYHSDYVGIYDPVANTYTQGPLATSTDGAFFGGVLMPNGKVCLVPLASDYVGIYDGLFGPVATGTLLHPVLNKF